jgi:hypothetical protein
MELLSQPSPPSSGVSALDAGAPWSPPLATNATGCAARGPLPDPACSPGAVGTTDLAVICGQGTRERRHVTEATRRAVFEAYGAPWDERAGYEVDHLISLELGGSNDVANLWPEPAEPRPGFHEKDAVENYLHREVCAGRMPLAEAQRVIATDWTKVLEAARR